jgi:tetratricopeptide (TPR) repeat protein
MLGAALSRSIPRTIGLWTLVLVFSSGAMQLFFGYVENYTLAFVAGMLYMAAGFGVVRGRTRLWVPVALFFVTAFCHVSGALLGASLAWLVMWRWTRMRSKRAARLFTPLLVLFAAAVAYGAGRHPTLGEYFLPLTADESGYGVLSADHLIDVANELFLLMPVFPVFIIMGIPLRRHPSDADWHFSLLALLPLAIYLLFFNPVIGLSRDWDLFSVVLWGILPLCVQVVRCAFASGRPVPHTVAIPAVAMALILTTSWIGVNASPRRSVERFQTVVAYQQHRLDYAYEILATTYHDQGRLADAIRAQETASSISQNPRHYFTLARYYAEYGDHDTSFQMLQTIVERHPRFRPARQELVAALFRRGRFTEVIAIAERGIQGNPEEPLYYYYAGMSLVRLGRIEEGRAALLQGQRLNPDPMLAEAIAAELRRIAADGPDR